MVANILLSNLNLFFYSSREADVVEIFIFEVKLFDDFDILILQPFLKKRFGFFWGINLLGVYFLLGKFSNLYPLTHFRKYRSCEGEFGDI